MAIARCGKRRIKIVLHRPLNRGCYWSCWKYTMLINRRFRRGYPIVLACLFGAVTLNATAAHIPGTAELGGWVYIDRNNDGHLAFSNEANPEFVIGDVTVSLFSKANNIETLVSTALTDQ